MTRTGEREIVKSINAQGGIGYITIEHYLTVEQKGEYCNMFSEVTIPVGSTLGYHEHHGNAETYVMTQGKGLYYDNDKTYEVTVGDVLYCKDGDGHGLDNTGELDIKFTALILKS